MPHIKREIRKSVVGQQNLVARWLIRLLANGHVLLEGVPGLATTTTVKALAECIKADFKQIQFTLDLLPSDLVGTLSHNRATNTYAVARRCTRHAT